MATADATIRIVAQDKTGKAFKKVKGNLDKTQKAFSALGRAIKIGFTVVIAGGIAKLVNFTDQFALLEARTKKASRGLGDYNKISGELFKITQRTGTALEDTVKLFEALARTAPDIGATKDQVLQMTESLEMMAVVSGATGEEIKNAMRQFSQAMAGGIVRAEEFNSIIENTPEIAAKIAEGMDMTVGQLRLAVVEGKVLSKEVFESILGQTDQIKSDFEAMPMTFARAFQMLKNSFQVLLGVLNEAGGATGAMADGVAAISRFIDSLVRRVKSGRLAAEFSEWSNALRLAGGYVGILKTEISNLFKRISNGAKLFDMFLDFPLTFRQLVVSVAATIDKTFGGLSMAWKMFVAKMKLIWNEFKYWFLSKWFTMLRQMVEGLDKIGLNKISKSIEKAADDVGDALDDISAASSRARSAISDLIEEKQKQVDIIDEVAVGIIGEIEAQKEANKALREGIGHTDQAAESMRDLSGELKNATESTSKFKDAFEGLFGEISDAWTDMWKDLFGGGKTEDVLKQFLNRVKKAFLDTLAEIFAEWTKKKIIEIFTGGGDGSSIISTITSFFTSAGKSSGEGFVSTLGTAISSGAKAIGSWFGKIFGSSASGALIPDGVGGFMPAGTSAGTSFVAGFKSVLGNLAGFAAPLALAAYGFSQIRKRRRQDKREFAALMADQTVRAKMFLGEMTTGFKVIKQEGGHAWLQVSEAMNDYMGNLHQAGSSKSKGHFLWHELVRVRDEFGNVIARARDVPKLWNQINNATPFLRAIEESDKLMSNMERMKNGVEGNYIAGQLSLIAQGAGAIDIAYQAMADGVITATESIEMGLGETAVGTAEAFRRMTQDALVTESGLIRMGQAGVDALLSIDQQSVEFRSAMEDNLLDQVEAVQFGLGGLGDIGKDTFESMMEWAMRASDTTSALHSVTDILGDEFVQLGDKAINALKKIDLNADKVKQAMADGVVDATEAAQLGFSELGSRSVEEFMKIIEAVKSASGNMANLEDAARRAADAARAAARAANPASGGRGMHHGGSFIVGGGGGTDSQPVSFMATPGERVSVETPNQSKASGSDGGNVVRELRALRKDLATVVAKPIVGAVTRGQLAMAGGARH